MYSIPLSRSFKTAAIAGRTWHIFINKSKEIRTILIRKKMSTGSVMEPHDRMRARDVNKVARGEQAPRPPQQSPPVSRPPPPSSTNPKVENKSDASESLSKKETASSDHMRRCYDTYYGYHRCVQAKGSEADECKKVADYYKSTCPEWIDQWSIKQN